MAVRKRVEEMKKIMVMLAVVVMFLGLTIITGCGKSTPGCADSDVKDGVLRFYKLTLIKELMNKKFNEMPQSKERFQIRTFKGADDFHAKYATLDDGWEVLYRTLSSSKPFNSILIDEQKSLPGYAKAKDFQDACKKEIEERENLELRDIRTVSKKDDIKKCSCSGKIYDLKKGSSVYDAEYSVQRTEEGKLWFQTNIK